MVYWLAELPEYIDAMACQRMIACIEADHDIIIMLPPAITQEEA